MKNLLVKFLIMEKFQILLLSKIVTLKFHFSYIHDYQFYLNIDYKVNSIDGNSTYSIMYLSYNPNFEYYSKILRIPIKKLKQ